MSDPTTLRGRCEAFVRGACQCHDAPDQWAGNCQRCTLAFVTGEVGRERSARESALAALLGEARNIVEWAPGDTTALVARIDAAMKGA